MAKITKTTFKNLLKKNNGNLFIQFISDFDGQSDCVEFIPSDRRKFRPLEWDKVEERDYQYGAEQGRTRQQVEENFFSNQNTLGYRGIWLVNQSRDSFQHYEDEKFTGIKVYNCCGSFIVAIQKPVNNNFYKDEYGVLIDKRGE